MKSRYTPLDMWYTYNLLYILQVVKQHKQEIMHFNICISTLGSPERLNFDCKCMIFKNYFIGDLKMSVTFYAVERRDKLGSKKQWTSSYKEQRV